MFTGIVEEVGVVREIQRGSKSSRLTIGADVVLSGTKVGDSICTSGVCLTATSVTGSTFVADVMAETMRRTKLGDLKVGSPVNLERALRPTDRLGGHFVSGHIDGTGTITRMEREDNAVWVTIAAPPQLLRYIIEKGSIAIDGISLTVAAVSDTTFQVSLIPHTGSATTLLHQQVGDTVNLECDMIGKYVEKLLGLSAPTKDKTESSAVTTAFLAEHGFL